MNTTFFPKKIFSFTTYFEQGHRTMVFLKNHTERYVAKMFFYWEKETLFTKEKNNPPVFLKRFPNKCFFQ